MILVSVCSVPVIVWKMTEWRGMDGPVRSTDRVGPLVDCKLHRQRVLAGMDSLEQAWPLPNEKHPTRDLVLLSLPIKHIGQSSCRHERTRMRTLFLHKTPRGWCINFSPLLVEVLRHREPQQGLLWNMDEVRTTVDGGRHWVWHAVDKYGFMQGALLQRHRNTEATRTLLIRLLIEGDVPGVIDTDQLRSSKTVIREIQRLISIDHRQVISGPRSDNRVEQQASVLYGVRAVQDKLIVPHGIKSDGERGSSSALYCPKQPLGFKLRKRAEEVLNLNTRIGGKRRRCSAVMQVRALGKSRCCSGQDSVSTITPGPCSTTIRRSGQTSSRASILPKKQSEPRVPDVANGPGWSGLNLQPLLPSVCLRATRPHLEG